MNLRSCGIIRSHQVIILEDGKIASWGGFFFGGGGIRPETTCSALICSYSIRCHDIQELAISS